MKRHQRWEPWQFAHTWELPTEGGCYAIYIQNELAYIGSTGNLRARITAYRFRISIGGSVWTPWGGYPYEAVKVKIRRARYYGEWATLELRLLNRLRPHLNCRSLGMERRA